MIIAFDGNVFSGKTSFIAGFCGSAKCVVVPEHSHFVADFRSHEDAWSVQQKYLDAEVKRHVYLLGMPSERLILVDRSFVSMAAHVWALYTTQGVDMRARFLGRVTRGIRSNWITLPNQFCHVVCDYPLIRARAAIDVVKRTDRFYMDENYLKAVDAFNRKWQIHFPGCLIDTSTEESAKASQQALVQHLRAVDQPQHDTEACCRRMEELLMRPRL